MHQFSEFRGRNSSLSIDRSDALYWYIVNTSPGLASLFFFRKSRCYSKLTLAFWGTH